MGRAEFKPGLESLRGIAAFAVALTHSVMVFRTAPAETPLFAWLASGVGWLITLLPAGASVVLFFVLSGYVLGISLMRDSRFAPFAVRRVFRIFPAYIMSLLLMAGLLHYLPLPSRTDTSEWFNNVYLPLPDATTLLRNIALLDTSINPVAWSLMPEVICGLLLPLVIFVHNRTDSVGRFCLLAALVFAANRPGQGATHFGFCFYAGFLIPSELGPRLKGRYVAALASAAGFALIVFGNKHAYNFSMRSTCALGSALLVAAVASPQNPCRWLDTKPFRFMGRISYSFYLFHLPVLYTLSYFAIAYPEALPHNYPTAMLLLIGSVAGAALLATLSHRYVESAGVAAGRNIMSFWGCPRILNSAAALQPTITRPRKAPLNSL